MIFPKPWVKMSKKRTDDPEWVEVSTIKLPPFIDILRNGFDFYLPPNFVLPVGFISQKFQSTLENPILCFIYQ